MEFSGLGRIQSVISFAGQTEARIARGYPIEVGVSCLVVGRGNIERKDKTEEHYRRAVLRRCFVTRAIVHQVDSEISYLERVGDLVVRERRVAIHNGAVIGNR